MKKNGKLQRFKPEKAVVREYQSGDEQEVQRIFSEGMEEMVTDTAFRGLRHHPESLLVYLAITVAVREYEGRDEQEVQRIFSEGMEEMVTDTAFRGLTHHPESLLMYLAITVSFLWISSCSWVIVLLPLAILYARYFYSFRAMDSYKKRALNTDMADIEGFYMKAPGSCLWVALVDGAVVGLVAAVQRSPDEVELKRMSVDRRHRCCGVGMALGRKVLEFASSQKFPKVILGTTNYTPAAHNLYKRLGFHCVGATNGYHTDSAGLGPCLFERLFYRVRHHHYELEMQHEENLK